LTEPCRRDHFETAGADILRATARADLAGWRTDRVTVGRHFIANAELASRHRHGWSLGA